MPKPRLLCLVKSRIVVTGRGVAEASSSVEEVVVDSVVAEEVDQALPEDVAEQALLNWTIRHTKSRAGDAGFRTGTLANQVPKSV